MSPGFPWSALGIEATGDTRAIRGAYAARIKAMDLDADVEGYARLRSARDTALRLAKEVAEPVEVAEPAETEPEEVAEPAETKPVETGPEPGTPPATWLWAAPALADPPAGEWQTEPALVTTAPAPGDELIGRVSPDLIAAGEGDRGPVIALPAGDPFAVPMLEGHDDASVVGQEALQSPFARLAAMLDPEGPAGRASLDEAEEEHARSLLGAVLDMVHASDITRQAEMETWLAGLMADAWPRSAPLLDEADAAFAWNREWGKVDARPAIEYLGARLRGYRFQRKVLAKDHIYHRAWAELVRPGPAGPLRFLRANGSDVRALLHGVRKHFPELEDHFDPQRVASWEQAKGGAGTVMLILFGLILLGALFNIGGKPQFDPDARSQAMDATLAEIFGPGHDMFWLKRYQPDLAAKLTDGLQFRDDGSLDRQSTTAQGIHSVRARTYLNGRQLNGTDFDTTMKLRLSLLKAAQAAGPAACHTMMTLASPPASTPIPPEVRTAERAFAASLAERGLLRSPDKLEGSSAKVPAALVARVAAATKLGKQDLAAAMQGKSDDAARCAVTVALLEATLGWEGKERRAILMTL